MAEKPRYTKWTKKDQEVHPWLFCTYVDYFANDFVRKVYKGQTYEERRKCGALCEWVVEYGDNIYYRCRVHRSAVP